MIHFPPHPLAAQIQRKLPADLRKHFAVCAAEEVTSTNTVLKQYAASAAADQKPIIPTLLLARSQSSGRGRMGRSFHSPGGTGLYMSVLLVPDMPPQKALRLTTAAAAACADAADALRGADTVARDGAVGIKWVNDLYLDGKKICGILAESALTPAGDALSWAVIGIGINILPPENGFPGSIAGTAGSLLPPGCTVDTDEVLTTLCADILVRLNAYLDPMASDDILAAYRRRSVLDGHAVLVRPAGSLGGAEIPATVLGIDEDFGLCVRYEDGTVAVLSSGEVLLHPQDNTEQSARASVHLR
ncbi:MAG: biotin--[acetyl-CoA-carboxylase] ligase [Ruminococcaceae bacterium]|nr:biotin--[acetyl-CoA-carboxylase] ligase [Oscillospiraceae bacterium]